jgi:Methyltransferase FkbM domain
MTSFTWGSLDPAYAQMYAQENFVAHTYERFNKVKENDVVLDIGANYGSFTYSILEKNPSHVYCVEPDPLALHGLSTNVGNGPVTIIPKAITAQYNFKSLLEETGLTKIDFMKFDCEGGEAFIFTQENSEFINANVSAAAGEWHIAGDGLTGTMDRFFTFRDNYLHKGRYKVYDRFSNDYTDLIWDNDRMYDLERYCWELYEQKVYTGQFMVYLWRE